MEVDGEVDGSMTPLEELDDTTKMTRKLARGLLYWFGCEHPITMVEGQYLYPRQNTSPKRLQFTNELLNKLGNYDSLP
jgi:hypothetical protein